MISTVKVLLFLLKARNSCTTNLVVGNHVTVNASHGCKELEDLNKIIEGNPPVVRVTDSNDVHFGKQVHYKGPVTIEKVVCSKTQIDFHALESKMWLNESTGDCLFACLEILNSSPSLQVLRRSN